MLRRTRFIFSFFCLFSAFSLFADDALTFVVTASRESEDIMDVPARMTVITTEDIQSSGKTSLVQILEDAAGVSFRSYSGEAQAQVSMRGFGENSFGRVIVLVDGKKLNNPDMAGLNWQSIPLSSIEKIEILDGPSAVLYGSGAVGGVINIITKESAAGVSAGATLSYGSFNTRRAQVNGGFGTDSAGFLVSADHYSTEGFRDRSESKTTNVTINGFADLTDKLTVKPSFSFSDIYYQMPGSLTEAQFEDDPTQAGNLEDDGTERGIGAALLTQLAASDNLSIELPLSYMKKDRKAEMVSWFSHTDRIQHQFEAKPKAAFNFDTGFGTSRVVGGLDYEGVLLNATSFTDEERTVESYKFDVSQHGYAPYVTGLVSLPGNLGVSAGARYNHASIKAEKDEASIDESAVYSGLVYDVSLIFKPSDSVSLYAKYNTLFRYPFIDEKAELTGMGDQFNSDLDSESGSNIEFGTKFQFKEFLSGSFTMYYMMMEDEIAFDSITYHNDNLDATKRLGGNLAVTLKPLAFLEMGGNIDYVQATFADGINKDNYVPLVPVLTAKSNLAFDFPAGINLGADVTYTGESRMGGDNANTQDMVGSYTLYGLTARFSPPVFAGKLSITGRCDNLLDDSYVPNVFYYGIYSPAGYYPAPGRSVTVSASYRY